MLLNPREPDDVREAQFVSSFSYDHIGQAEDERSSIWVDLAPRQSSASSSKTIANAILTMSPSPPETGRASLARVHKHQLESGAPIATTDYDPQSYGKEFKREASSRQEPSQEVFPGAIGSSNLRAENRLRGSVAKLGRASQERQRSTPSMTWEAQHLVGEGIRKIRERGERRVKGYERVKRKKHPAYLDGGGASDRCESVEDIDDLTQNLNQDAFVRSTGGTNKKKRRAKLLEKYKRKRDGQLTDSEYAHESDSPAESSSASSESSTTSTFSPLPHERSRRSEFDGEKMSRLAQGHSAKWKKSSFISTSTSTSAVLHTLGIGARLTLKEQCDEWVRWITSQILDSFESIAKDRRIALSQVRRELREKLKEDSNQILSQDMRRQFNWYLRRHPFFERRNLVSRDRQSTVGCAACHRRKQTCDSQFLLWGPPYHGENLEKKDSSDSSCSERSTGAEDERHETGDGQGTHVFFLGSHCARRAALLHRYAHWEHKAMRELSKMPIIKKSRKALKEITRQGDDVSYGRLAGQAIEDAVTQYSGQLERRLKKLNDKRDEFLFRRLKAGEAHERWDDW